MKRREFLKMAAAGALASMSKVSFGSGKTPKPNFVFIIADDCTFRTTIRQVLVFFACFSCGDFRKSFNGSG